jgi:hypothetical protein
MTKPTRPQGRPALNESESDEQPSFREDLNTGHHQLYAMTMLPKHQATMEKLCIKMQK